MKFVRVGHVGKEQAGVLDKQGNVRSLMSIVNDITPKTLPLLHALGYEQVEQLPIIEHVERFGACIAEPQKFVAIGLNYYSHAQEMNMPIPQEPVVFSKWLSSICGANDDIILPPESQKTDWEIELGIVIGKRCQYISEQEAEAFIWGYCLINDISEREYQLERGGSWDKGKGFDTFGPIGPYLVRKDSVIDPHQLQMELKVNGETFQRVSTSDMIFSVHNLVSYLSQTMTLLPGDIIATGTPAGVGAGLKPPKFLKEGDVLTSTMDLLGHQEHRVVRYCSY